MLTSAFKTKVCFILVLGYCIKHFVPTQAIFRDNL